MQPNAHRQPHTRTPKHTASGSSIFPIQLAVHPFQVATNLDPWGPTQAQMEEICKASFNYEDRRLIMRALWKRLSTATAKEWPHIHKSLTVMEFFAPQWARLNRGGNGAEVVPLEDAARLPGGGGEGNTCLPTRTPPTRAPVRTNSSLGEGATLS